jgi:hypothetical protein
MIKLLALALFLVPFAAVILASYYWKTEKQEPWAQPEDEE